MPDAPEKLLDWLTDAHDRFPRVYLCGPMTGYPEFNHQAFRAATGRLVNLGFNVISPVEMDDADGVDYGNIEHDTESDEYRRFLLRDLVAILEAKVDAFVVLDGWEESKGAALEVTIARHLGIPVYAESTYEPVKAPSKYRPPTDESIAEEAQRLVGGARQEQYGHPIVDFTRTAGAINALFGTSFEARDIPVLMIVVKLSRVIQSPTKRDSFTDIIGYALTRAMVAEKEGRPLE